MTRWRQDSALGGGESSANSEAQDKQVKMDPAGALPEGSAHLPVLKKWSPWQQGGRLATRPWVSLEALGARVLCVKVSC